MNEPGSNVHRLGNLIAASSPMFLEDGEFDLFRVENVGGKASLSWLGTFNDEEKQRLSKLLEAL